MCHGAHTKDEHGIEDILKITVFNIDKQGKADTDRNRSVTIDQTTSNWTDQTINAQDNW